MSLTQAEAVMEIISAEGRQGAALAKSAWTARWHGALQASGPLQTLAAHLTAWIDYPEEDVPEVSRGRADSHTERAEGHAGPADCRVRGRGGFAPRVDCVLLGRPNVGKSTLLNLLAGFDRAIVTPVAGTTRDVVEQAVHAGDRIRLNLFDTAGVRDVGETAMLWKPRASAAAGKSWRKPGWCWPCSTWPPR